MCAPGSPEKSSENDFYDYAKIQEFRSLANNIGNNLAIMLRTQSFISLAGLTVLVFHSFMASRISV